METQQALVEYNSLTTKIEDKIEEVKELKSLQCKLRGMTMRWNLSGSVEWSGLADRVDEAKLEFADLVLAQDELEQHI